MRARTIHALGTAALLALSVAPAGAVAAEWGPWDAPALTAPSGDREEPGVLGAIALAVISFYQQRMPALTASHCRMQPSCSRFGREAIETHGAVLGTVLTFDRLLHEGNEGAVSPVVMSPDGPRVLDPVANNLPWEPRR